MRREFGMFVALLLLCAGLWFSNSAFLGQSNVLNTTRQISMLGILAIGSSFVILTGGIDLSVGSLVGLTGVILARLSSHGDEGFHWPLWLGILAALAVALLIGLMQGLLITRVNLQPFIVTLGFMLMLRGVSQTIVHGGDISFSEFRKFANAVTTDINDVLGFFGLHFNSRLVLPVPPLLLVLMAVALISAYILHFTVFGRYIFAIGGNRDAAQYSGIPVKKIETITYVISAGLAGVAGICYASYIGEMSQNVGVAYELYAIASCVLGGCSLRGGEGTVIGVLIGTALMKVIEDGLDMFQFIYKDKMGRPRFWKPDENWRYIVIGVVILLAVILDQVVHMIQQRRRTKAAGNAPTLPPTEPPRSGFPVVGVSDRVAKID